MIRLLLLLSLCILTACSSPKIEPTVPIVPKKEQVQIDPELLKECDDLSSYAERAQTQLDVVNKSAEWAATNTACKNRHHGLVAVVRKAFNLDRSDVKTPDSKY